MIRVVIIAVFLVSCSVSKRPVIREVIRLSGIKSKGQIVSYHWRQILGPYVRIEEPGGVVTYGDFKGPGIYKFELTVTDKVGLISKDTAVLIRR